MHSHGSVLLERLLDLLVRLVLAQRIHRPDGGRQPADQRELQDQADDPRERAANGEESQEGQEDGQDQAQGRSST